MRGDITKAILEVLEFGAMTVHEMSFETGYDIRQLHVATYRLSKTQKMLPKRIYVKHWVFFKTKNHFLSQRVWCPAYALGDKPCAPKPKTRTNAERIRAQRQLKKQRIANSSIFNWSKTA